MWAQKQQREMAMRKYYRSRPCPDSTTYDQAHVDAKGLACKYRHNYYHWNGIRDNRILLVSDSIMKWVKEIAHLEIKAYPGLKLASALARIRTNDIDCSNHEGIILALGSNDISSKTDKREIFRMTIAIVTFLKQTFPEMRIALMFIIPRPGDKNALTDEKRCEVNTIIRSWCRRQRITYIYTWRAISVNQQLNLALYAQDKIHLNRGGILAIRRYLIGAVAAFVGYKPRSQR
jgi:lysophospholipase L1-like esterase